MIKTQQRSIRLSPFHLRIVEELQLEKGYTFTDAVKEMIEEYGNHKANENHINRFVKKFEQALSGINSQGPESIDKTYEIIDTLQIILNMLEPIKNGVSLLGSADPRTAGEMEDLMKGEKYENL